MHKLDTTARHGNQEPAPKKDLTMVRSTLPGFRKQNEIVVLKNRVFKIQSVSPKKLILKLIDNIKNTPDGIYCMAINKPNTIAPMQNPDMAADANQPANEKPIINE